MKNILFTVIMFCTFVYPVQAEYTTHDGAITLDFHEDANLPARWLLDVTMNDLDPSDFGYFENLHFDIHVKNMPMRFTDSENNTSSDYYKMYGMYIGGLIPSPLMPEFHDPSSDDPSAVIPNSENQDTSGTFISSINPLFIRYFEDPPDPVTWSCIVTYGKEPSPAGTSYLFFANNKREGYDIVTGDLLFSLEWWSEGDDTHQEETFTLLGPVGYSAVPEPISVAMFAFGALLLKSFIKKKA